MQAGLLNETIVVERLHAVKEHNYGEEREVWQFAFKTRANVTYGGGNRGIENEEIVFNETLTFTIRIYQPVKKEDRILFKGNYYRIVAPIEERKMEQSKVIRAELINE